MLELIAKHHSTWVGYLINNGCPASIAEDIVQEMYLKIDRSCVTLKRIMYNEKEINHGYIRVALLNLYKDYYKAKQRVKVVSIDENPVVWNELSEQEYECGIEKEKEIQEQHQKDVDFINRITREINSFKDEYNRNAARAYFLYPFSMREIAKESGISLTSLFNSIKHYRAILEDRLGVDLTEQSNLILWIF